jgi:hypothetical protein
MSGIFPLVEFAEQTPKLSAADGQHASSMVLSMSVVIVFLPTLKKGSPLRAAALPLLPAGLFPHVPAVPVVFFEPPINYAFGKPDVYPQLAKGNTALYHPMP